LVFKLPSGSWAGITAKRDEFPDGTEIIGKGIPPDIEVRQTLKEFRNGVDPVLARAQEELTKD
jgi:C-terminal processing protease CtpA/Prc